MVTKILWFTEGVNQWMITLLRLFSYYPFLLFRLKIFSNKVVVQILYWVLNIRFILIVFQLLLFWCFACNLIWMAIVILYLKLIIDLFNFLAVVFVNNSQLFLYLSLLLIKIYEVLLYKRLHVDLLVVGSYWVVVTLYDYRKGRHFAK